MSKSDTKSDSKQDASISRERIACLKKIAGKQFLKRIVERRKLDKRLSNKCPAYLMVWFIVGFCEVGSLVFFNFHAKPIRCGEATMAKHVYKGLPENSRLLFDIGFCVSQLMMMVIDQNSDFTMNVGKKKLRSTKSKLTCETARRFAVTVLRA